MGKWTGLFSKKWLILGLLCALFPLFQNMSPSDEYQDIRELAPRKPAGDWDRPMASLIPQNFSGSDMKDVERSFLSHNFDPMLKDLEISYLQGDQRRFEFSNREDNGNPKGEELGKWKIGLVNPTKIRLSFENQVAGQNFQFVCEAQSGHDGMSLRMTRPFSSQFNVGLTHETSRRESQVQMDYRW